METFHKQDLETQVRLGQIEMFTPEQVKQYAEENYVEIKKSTNADEISKGLNEVAQEVISFRPVTMFEDVKDAVGSGSHIKKSIMMIRPAQILWDEPDANDIQKARGGIYLDTEENRRLKRVGQRYGSPAKEGVKETLNWHELPDGDVTAEKGGKKFLIYKGGGNDWMLMIDGKTTMKGTKAVCKAGAERAAKGEAGSMFANKTTLTVGDVKDQPMNEFQEYVDNATPAMVETIYNSMTTSPADQSKYWDKIQYIDNNKGGKKKDKMTFSSVHLSSVKPEYGGGMGLYVTMKDGTKHAIRLTKAELASMKEGPMVHPDIKPTMTMHQMAEKKIKEGNYDKIVKLEETKKPELDTGGMENDIAVSHFHDVDYKIGAKLGFKKLSNFSAFVDKYGDKYYQAMAMSGFDPEEEKYLGGATANSVVDKMVEKMRPDAERFKTRTSEPNPELADPIYKQTSAKDLENYGGYTGLALEAVMNSQGNPKERHNVASIFKQSGMSKGKFLSKIKSDLYEQADLMGEENLNMMFDGEEDKGKTMQQKEDEWVADTYNYIEGIVNGLA